MNPRTLTRGDVAVGGAAVLLFVFSFMPYYKVDVSGYSGASDSTANMWKSELFPLLPSVVLMGVIAAALIVAGRFVPQQKPLAGLTLPQWGTAFTVTTAWAAIWAQGGGLEGADHAWGSYLVLLFSLVLAAAAVASQLVPALGLPLTSGTGQPGPGQFQQQPGGWQQQPQPGWQQQPGGWQQPQQVQQQPGGYGYPGQQQPQQAGGYGFPNPAEQTAQMSPQQQAQQPQPQQAQPQPQQQQQPQPQAQAQQPGAEQGFSPYWFAVPEPRPLMPEDGSQGAPVAQLQPGVWHLAMEQRGGALLVEQYPDKRRGLLTNVAGIQRG